MLEGDLKSDLISSVIPSLDPLLVSSFSGPARVEEPVPPLTRRVRVDQTRAPRVDLRGVKGAFPSAWSGSLSGEVCRKPDFP